MLVNFFQGLKDGGVPVTPRELLDLLAAMNKQLVFGSIDDFYNLSRAVMVKDEKYYDRFDRAFGLHFRDLEGVDDVIEALIPDDWLRSEFVKQLSEEDKAKIESLGGLEKLIDEFKKRLEEQEKRHEGGNKWVGTGGTSPFGNDGFHPEGIRVGGQGKNKKAVKVWDRRDFKNLDDSVELGTRNIKVALKRLRRWARDGASEEFDLDGTVNATANAGYLDVKTRPERRNAVKVLLFFDVGGSMDAHIKVVEELFSAAKSEFKQLEHFYFHNCLYESVWRDNARRWDDKIPTAEILRTYGPDYKCIFVGDASMSPYEIAYIGGANEYWNDEAGHTWLNRARAQWANHLWINPVPEAYWNYTQSIGMIREIFENQMVPMTPEGLTRGMKLLG